MITRQKHLFIVDPIQNLNIQLDTSLRVSHALIAQNHWVDFCYLEGLSCDERSNGVYGEVASLSFFEGDITRPQLGNWKKTSLAGYNSIQVRKDPPFDARYLSMTWILGRLRGANVKIVNPPEALRSNNEKLLILDYPDYSRPALLTANPEDMLHFARQHQAKTLIVKPLDLFGGRGVEKVPVEDSDMARKTLQDLTQGGVTHRFVQAFDESIHQGELRVFAVGGKIISWCLKRPKEGSYLANTASGARLEPYTPPASLVEGLSQVTDHLHKRGISVVGLDVIGGKISEINITSPRLLLAPGQSSQPYVDFANWIADFSR